MSTYSQTLSTNSKAAGRVIHTRINGRIGDRAPVSGLAISDVILVLLEHPTAKESIDGLNFSIYAAILPNLAVEFVYVSWLTDTMDSQSNLFILGFSN